MKQKNFQKFQIQLRLVAEKILKEIKKIKRAEKWSETTEIFQLFVRLS